MSKGEKNFSRGMLVRLNSWSEWFLKKAKVVTSNITFGTLFYRDL